jgi:hypothetical protein
MSEAEDFIVKNKQERKICNYENRSKHRTKKL